MFKNKLLELKNYHKNKKSRPNSLLKEPIGTILRFAPNLIDFEFKR